MTEEKIKELIQEYVCEEMNLLPQTDDLPDHPPYSNKFNKAMKKIKRSADYFGGNLKFYVAFTRTAAAILIVFSLVAANQASATLLGFNPWKELTKVFLTDVKMEQKTYTKNDTEQASGLQAIADIPSYIPEGYKEVDRQTGNTTIAAEWEKKNQDGTTTGIAYARDKMSEDAVFLEDKEYDYEKSTKLAGYEAKIYYKHDRVWISWIDNHYNYIIWTSDTKTGDEIIKQMAESIYQNK